MWGYLTFDILFLFLASHPLMQITGGLRGSESMPPESADLDLIFRVHTGS
jgi:hypothetical protein